MGKHSSIGPVDPQLNGLPALGVLQEFERAQNELSEDHSRSLLWDPILAQIPPSFISQCGWAVDRSNMFLRKALRDGMFLDTPADQIEKRVQRAVDGLTSSQADKAHYRHIHYDECKSMGLNITLLEDGDKIFQDLVLTVHHTFMHTLSNTASLKIIENHLGRAQVRMSPQQAVQMPPDLAQLFGLQPQPAVAPAAEDVEEP